MPGPVLTDEQIDALSQQERQELMWRLARPSRELMAAETLLRIRRRRVVMMTAAVLALIPWTVYLGLSLPDRYVAQNWSVTWVGFDALLLTMFALTALLGWRRRLLLILAAFTSGVLLVCDAWFDVTTAAPGDFWLSVGFAVVLELPVAAVLITSALRLIRLVAARVWLLTPGTRMWQAPIPLDDLFERP
jgi:hypothetical protein